MAFIPKVINERMPCVGQPSQRNSHVSLQRLLALYVGKSTQERATRVRLVHSEGQITKQTPAPVRTNLVHPRSKTALVQSINVTPPTFSQRDRRCMVILVTIALIFGVWRSLAARSVRDAEVAGSNPVTPTTSFVKYLTLKMVSILLTGSLPEIF